MNNIRLKLTADHIFMLASLCQMHLRTDLKGKSNTDKASLSNIAALYKKLIQKSLLNSSKKLQSFSFTQAEAYSFLSMIEQCQISTFAIWETVELNKIIQEFDKKLP